MQEVKLQLGEATLLAVTAGGIHSFYIEETLITRPAIKLYWIIKYINNFKVSQAC